jgi:hypothetical protein
MRKYRIVERPNGKYGIGVQASQTEHELWVPASIEDFPCFESAEEGLRRIIANKAWYYDEAGAFLWQGKVE